MIKSDAVIWWAAIFRRAGASFVPGPFWDPSEAVPGSSSAFLERSRFVPWPSRSFFPKNFPWHLVTRIQFRIETAACWPILAVVGLSFLGSGTKQDEDVCEYSERESSCWAGDTVIHQGAQLYLDCHRCADQESDFDTMPAKEDTERYVCCHMKWDMPKVCVVAVHDSVACRWHRHVPTFQVWRSAGGVRVSGEGWMDWLDGCVPLLGLCAIPGTSNQLGPATCSARSMRFDGLTLSTGH